MRRSLLSALALGTAVTAGKLFVVVQLTPSSSPPAPPRPDPQRTMRIAAPPPPPPQRTPREAPAPLANDRLRPAPAPRLAPSPMPALGDLHPGAELAAVLPELGGLRGRMGALRVGAAASSAGTDRPAVARDRPAPRYPDLARRRGIEGYVVVRMRIDETGRVDDVVVVDAKPPGVFDLAAKQAASRFTYHPARSGGEPVAATLEQRILFRLR